MNEQTPPNNTESEPISRHEARQQRREARREVLGGGGSLTWIAGILLILLGIGFLLQTMGPFSIALHNWWALFILLPALGAFDTAIRVYKQNDNRLVASVRGSLLSGAILTLVTAMFLFELDWKYFGPVLIILAGIGIFAGAALPGKK
jgi:hypothetical protein